MSIRVALATCRILPEPDHDESLLVAELSKAGFEVEVTAWDDASVDWGAFDACVLRSTWNYYESLEVFRRWIALASAKTKLLNPPTVLEGNLEKTYLAELESVGVHTVPTHFVSDGRELDSFVFPTKFVVKPAISAGSYRTRVFDSHEREAAIGHCLWILGDGRAMVQPYIPSVASGGEIAWVWIDGEVTHGIRKMPRFSEDDESVTDGFAPTDSDLERLEPILAHVDPACLYARIDVMEQEGKWLLSELELIEPSLFFKQFPAALEKFSAALMKRLA